jgi:hypothetical protein
LNRIGETVLGAQVEKRLTEGRAISDAFGDELVVDFVNVQV